VASLLLAVFAHHGSLGLTSIFHASHMMIFGLVG
jgi:hypothetical protein